MTGEQIINGDRQITGLCQRFAGVAADKPGAARDYDRAT
jgi:hypothetical protein